MCGQDEMSLCFFHFCQLDTFKSYLERGNLGWENASLRLACRLDCEEFSWLMIDMEGQSHWGWCQTWPGGSELYKESNPKEAWRTSQ